MTTTIKTKNSTTASDTPSSLSQGELAVNIADKKIFIGDNNGTVVDLAIANNPSPENFTISKNLPTLICSNTTPVQGANGIMGKIQFAGLTNSATYDDVGSIQCKSATYFTGGSAYTNLHFYTRFGANASEVARFEDGGEIYFPSVHYDTVTSSRPLYIQSNGKLGYVASIRESKTNITDLTDVSWVYNLDPVSFNYRDLETTRAEDGTKLETYADTHSSELEYGLIAEDVETVNDELVFYNGDDLAGVHYKKLVVPMLKIIQDQKEVIDALTTRVTALENA
jgi:hypothetical protein